MFPSNRQVAYVLLTSPPLTAPIVNYRLSPFDLHVLCAPPAFILSQDQTLLFLVSIFCLSTYINLFLLQVFLTWISLLAFPYFLIYLAILFCITAWLFFSKGFIVYFSMYFVIPYGTFCIILYLFLIVNTFLKIFFIFLFLNKKCKIKN